MTDLKDNLHAAVLASETKTRRPGTVVLAIDRERFEELAAPFYETAYEDGRQAVNREQWESFSVQELREFAESAGMPMPASEHCDILRMIWRLCRIAWLEGRLEASEAGRH